MQNGFLKRYGKHIFIGLAVLSLVAAAIIGQLGAKKADVEEYLVDILPAGASASLMAERPAEDNYLYEVFEGGSITGYVAFGVGKGFGGPMLVMVLWSTEGVCLDIQVSLHHESKAWYDRLTADFFAQFIGKTYNSNFVLGEDVDAVSNATRSSEGVNNGFLDGLYFMVQNVDAFGDVAIPSNPIQITPQVIVLVILLALVFTIRMVPALAKIGALRYLTLFLAFLTIGIFFSAPLSLSNFAVYLVGFSPDISTNFYVYILVFAVVGLILIFGKNFYCYWMCPFCAVQEGAHFLGANQIRPVTKRHLLFRNMRYVVLWLALILVLLMRNPAFAVFEPWGTLFTLSGDIMNWVLLGLVIAIGLFVYNFWCHYLCPVGATLDIVLKVRRWFVGLLKKTV